MSTHLTDNQRMLMNGFNTEPRPFSFWDGGFVTEDSGTYMSEFVSEVAHIIGKPESSATRTIHDLVKKGIFTSKDVEAEEPIMSTDGKTMVQEGKPADHWIELTDAGVELISDLRIEEDEAMLDMELDDEDEEPIVETMVTKAARKRKAEVAGQKEAAKADIAVGKPGLRTSHANCTHETHGKAGKIARAKCRRERAALAAAAAKAEEKVNA